MSRGPGRVERAIEALLLRGKKIDNAYTTEELCEHVFPKTEVERKHRVAVLRAAHRLRQRPGCEDLHVMEGDNLGCTSVWYNRASVTSYGMARMKADGINDYRSRDERRNWATDLSAEEEERNLRALLRRGKGRGRTRDGYRDTIGPGGGWYVGTQEWITERDLRRAGDEKALQKFLAEQKARR
jgi:hypothetical protein